MAKMIIISDYLFFWDGKQYYSEVPWNEDVYKLYYPEIDKIYITGRLRKIKAPDYTKHLVADKYFELLPLPDWSHPIEMIWKLPSSSFKLLSYINSADVIFIKLFYFYSVVGFFINKFILRKPSVSLLVGDSAEAANLRKDIIRSNSLRKVSSKIVYRLIRYIQNNVNVAGFVADHLRVKYRCTNQNFVIANESWLTNHMYQQPRKMKNKPPVVLFVGRLIESKNVKGLVKSLIELLEDGFVFETIIVGDGPLKQELFQLVRNSGYDRMFEFKGWVRPLSDELFSIYRRADILCLPTFAEGLPLVLLEAMANGVAVVATAVSGIPELIKTGENGILIKPNDQAELKAAIISLLEDEELWYRCVLNGYVTATRNSFLEQRSKIAIKTLQLISKRN